MNSVVASGPLSLRSAISNQRLLDCAPHCCLLDEKMSITRPFRAIDLLKFNNMHVRVRWGFRHRLYLFWQKSGHMD
jgi:hypothetical protein